MENSNKIGVVTSFDGYLGEIDSNNIIYYFERSNINDNEELKVGDKVIFKSKTENTFPQAYYIKKYNEERN